MQDLFLLFDKQFFKLLLHAPIQNCPSPPLLTLQLSHASHIFVLDFCSVSEWVPRDYALFRSVSLLTDPLSFSNSPSFYTVCILHSEPKENEEQKILMEKVKKMETVTHALTRKVLSLEEEVKELKKKEKRYDNENITYGNR